jgi:hypothetical protein
LIDDGAASITWSLQMIASQVLSKVVANKLILCVIAGSKREAAIPAPCMHASAHVIILSLPHHMSGLIACLLTDCLSLMFTPASSPHF